jgi:hypothetical protein
MCGMCVYFHIQETCTSSSAPQEVCEPTNDLPKFSPDLCNDCDARLPSEPVSSSRVLYVETTCPILIINLNFAATCLKLDLVL